MKPQPTLQVLQHDATLNVYDTFTCNNWLNVNNLKFFKYFLGQHTLFIDVIGLLLKVPVKLNIFQVFRANCTENLSSQFWFSIHFLQRAH